MRPHFSIVVVAALAFTACSSPSTSTSGSTNPPPTPGSSASSTTAPTSGSTEPGAAPKAGAPVASVTGGEIDITGGGDGEVTFPVSGRYYLATLKTADPVASATFTIKGRELPAVMGMGAQTTIFKVPEGQSQVTFVVEAVNGGYTLHLAAPPSAATAKPAPQTASGEGKVHAVTPVVAMPAKVGVTFANTGTKAGMSICVAMIYDAASGDEVMHVNLSSAGTDDTQYNENVKGNVFAIVSCDSPLRLDFLG